MNCQNCETKLWHKGIIQKSGVPHMRLYCKTCKIGTYVPEESVGVTQGLSVAPGVPQRYIVTSAINNTEIDKNFYSALQTYALDMSSTLIVLPLHYALDSFDEVTWPVPVHTSRLDVANTIILGGLRTTPVGDNPLVGLDVTYRGYSVIVPSTQVRMKVAPVTSGWAPVNISTGTISVANFAMNRAGQRAESRHTLGATILEVSEDGTEHIRHIEWDGECFVDIDRAWTPNGSRAVAVGALVLGDEHVMFHSPDVYSATFSAQDSLINRCRPKWIVRHDLIDSYTISHHHARNKITKFRKHVEGADVLSRELDGAAEHVRNTTPEYANTAIVSSNHHDHITQWLNEVDISREPQNALVYHMFMFLILDGISRKIKPRSPLELWFQHAGVRRTQFIDRDESFQIAGIELNNHGDVGVNGARGSVAGFSKVPGKYVIGHSHTPGITGDSYQVGTSSKLKLEYTRGPSSWSNTHCIIHGNGTRQLITIKNSSFSA